MIHRLSTCRAFFITKAGWTGTGPSGILREDEVVRIMGLLTPCVLRKVKDQDDYLFVGGCYVHNDDYWGEITMVSIV